MPQLHHIENAELGYGKALAGRELKEVVRSTGNLGASTEIQRAAKWGETGEGVCCSDA
jgi:hypothetical protein